MILVLSLLWVVLSWLSSLSPYRALGDIFENFSIEMLSTLFMLVMGILGFCGLFLRDYLHRRAGANADGTSQAKPGMGESNEHEVISQPRQSI